MTKDVITIGPEASLKDLAGILAERGISGLPVVDGEGQLIGVVSEADVLLKEAGPDKRSGGFWGWLLSGGPLTDAKLAARTVGEAMTSPALSIEASRAVHEAARMMTEYAVNRLPVVEDGKLVGIVTRADLVRAFTRTDAEILDEIRNELILRTLWIRPERVKVTASVGNVSLAGRVETKTDAELLPRLVERVPGVVSVTSELTWEYDERPLQRSEPREERR
jgi:CBS domain-containing protein